MTSIPGNLFLLGIVISILFFALGVRSFRFKKQWFEGAIYFIISAFSTCLLARIALNPIAFDNSELVIESARSCWAIAIIGMFIGWFAPFRMLMHKKRSMKTVVKSVILVLLFVVYAYMSPWLLCPFETGLDGTVESIDGMNNGFAILVLVYFISMAVSSIVEVYESKKADKAKDGGHVKYIDFKKELRKRKPIEEDAKTIQKKKVKKKVNMGQP